MSAPTRGTIQNRSNGIMFICATIIDIDTKTSSVIIREGMWNFFSQPSSMILHTHDATGGDMAITYMGILEIKKIVHYQP